MIKGNYYILSDGTKRKFGYRKEQNNWLLPLFENNYQLNIVNNINGYSQTITTSSPPTILLDPTEKNEYKEKKNMEKITDKQIKLVEAFAGYGSQRMALKNLGYSFTKNPDNIATIQLSSIIEWNINSIIAYANIHHKKELDLKIEKLTHAHTNKQDLINIIMDNYTLSTETKKVDGNYLPCDEKQYQRMSMEKLILILAANLVSNNLGSIMDVKGNEIDGADIFTYSFPCQDLSIAGKQRGITRTSRSGLLYQVERLLKEQTFEKRPKVLLMENVKNLISKRFKQNFDEWINILNELGYTTTWKVLNAKEHGVPQNRERVFAVSIKNGENIKFNFNNIYTQELELKLKNYLEGYADESYYLDDSHIQNILANDYTEEILLNGKNLIEGINQSSPKYKSDNIIHGENYIISALRAGGTTQLVAKSIKDNIILLPHDEIIKFKQFDYFKENKKQYVKDKKIILSQDWVNGKVTDGVVGWDFTIDSFQQISRIYASNGFSPATQTTPSTKIAKLEEYYLSDAMKLYIADYDGKFLNKAIINKEISKTITTREGSVRADLTNYFSNEVGENFDLKTLDKEKLLKLRIRKITPREALRLMGVTDHDIDLIFEKVTSKSAQYKLAGNSIVVNVLEKIFANIEW